jgi:predicted DNA-binding transcriptional regulator YafY
MAYPRAVRASRLVNLLLLLQARGGLTAAQIAAELEVSERTVHRDVEALAEAGVPIYAERGPHGGIRLVDGYRTRLTGMTEEEAEAVFLSGVPGPAAELGLGRVAAAGRLKVLAALPPELRSRAARLGQRFHLDAPGWFHHSEGSPCLAELASAVWEDRRVRVRYDRGDREVERELDPMGLVLKGGVWYLVAVSDGQLRTYRASRVLEARVLDQRFRRDEAFDLAAYWAESTAAYEQTVERVAVHLRVHPRAVGEVRDALGAPSVEESREHDPLGWHHVRVSLAWPAEAHLRILALGAAVEVLEPSELRDRIVTEARGVLDRYTPAPAEETVRGGPRPA